MRERIEEHRANPACAGCHKIMDPIGLALENFDGDRPLAHRCDSGAQPIDASGQLVDGTPLDGPSSLREALLDRPEAFVGCDDGEAADVRRRPRNEAYYDMPVGARVMRDAATRSLPVLGSGAGIVKSAAVSDAGEES